MKSFLERRDRWGNGVSLWLIVGLAFLAPLIAWSLCQIRLDNEVTSWLPKGDPQYRILDWYQSLFPADDRVLVSWDDCSLTDPRLRAFQQQLAGRRVNDHVEGGSPYVADVTLPSDLLSRMLREEVPFDVALQRVHGLLIGDGPLCIDLSDASESHSMIVGTAIQRLALEQFGLDVTLSSQTLPAPARPAESVEDEAAWKLHDAVTEYVASLQPSDLQLTWPRMHLDKKKSAAFIAALDGLIVKAADSSPCVVGHWFVPGSMAAASVRFSDAGEADATAALAAIRQAAIDVGVAASDLRLGGRPVTATEINGAVSRAAWNSGAAFWNLPSRSPMLLSLVVSTLLTWYMLGSLRLCLLVQGVSAICAAGTAALVPASGGTMNMVLIVMPTLLMVITVSGAIHVCNYWRNAGTGNSAEAVHKAVAVAWLPCLLACATTGIGMASLISGSLLPIRDFGLYAAIGSAFSFVCVVCLLPALMLFWPASVQPPAVSEHRFWNRLGTFLTRHATANCLFNLALTAACLVGMVWFRTETKIIRYFPESSSVVQDYNFLEENLSGIVSVDALVRFSSAQQERVPFPERARKILEVQEALRQHSEVSGTLSLASFVNLPEPGAAQSASERRQNRLRKNLMGDRVHEILKAGGRDAESLSALVQVTATAADWKQPGDHLLNEAGDEIWRITCQTSLMSDYDYEQLTRELNEIASTHLKSFEYGQPEHVVTGLVPILLRTQQALLESLISSFGLAFIMIAGVMMILLRNVSAALWSMLPNIMPIGIVFGMLGWSGVRIDIGTMITASIALGIAVDGTLHLMTWFRKQLEAGVSREEAVTRSLAHCGPALWQTSAAIGFGMLTLLPVELLLASRFGWIMSAMVFAALWGDVVLLPSLLAGPLGRVMEQMVKRSNVATDRNDRQEPPKPPMIAVETPLRTRIEAELVEPRAACVVPRAPHIRRLGSIFPRPVSEV